MAFQHLKFCLDRKMNTQQIAGHLHAIVNGMIEEAKFEEIDTDKVDWDTLAADASNLLKQEAAEFGV